MKRLLAVLLCCLLLSACAVPEKPTENPFPVYPTREFENDNGFHLNPPEGYPMETLFEELVVLTEKSAAGGLIEVEVQFVEDGPTAFTGLEEGSLEYLKAKVRRDDYLRLLKITKVHKGDFEEGEYVLYRCAAHNEGHAPIFRPLETYLLCADRWEEEQVGTQHGGLVASHTSAGIFYLDGGKVFPAADAEEYERFSSISVKEFLRLWKETADEMLPKYDAFRAASRDENE